MCKTGIHQFLSELPKCEHHIHIEGSLSAELLFELSKANKIVLPREDPAFASPSTLEERYEHFKDLNDFLHYYFIGMTVLITSHDFELLGYQYLKRAHADGVHHAEIFFDPQAHTTRGVKYTTVVEGLTRAQARAETDFGVSSKLILCFLRHLPQIDAHGVYQEAASLGHFSDGTVAGIGLDSAEINYPPEIFKDVYVSAKAAGLHRTAHGGEEGDPSYISKALDLCFVERIDHGRRLVEDEQLLKRVAANKTMLTLCPLSNVRLKGVTTVSELPIRRFLDEGVRFSINSDDPAYFGGYILDNYCAIQDAFNLSLQEWKYIADGSISGSWCDDERKKVLLRKVDECVTKHSAGNA